MSIVDLIKYCFKSRLHSRHLRYIITLWGYEIQDRLKLITKKKKRILGVTIVYDFLAMSHRVRAGPNAKTKTTGLTNSFTTLLAGFEGTDDGSAVRPCQNKTLSTWINRINFKNPICLSLTTLSNCSTNDVLADLNHKLKIETESEMPKNRHGLKQSIKILGNGDNVIMIWIACRQNDLTYQTDHLSSVI